MCRKNYLLSCCGVCFGLGLLVGCSLESGLLSTFLGIGLICLGIFFLRQK